MRRRFGAAVGFDTSGRGRPLESRWPHCAFHASEPQVAPTVPLLLSPEAVAQTMCSLDFLCVRDKVAILDRTISVAVEPPWPAERL